MRLRPQEIRLNHARLRQPSHGGDALPEDQGNCERSPKGSDSGLVRPLLDPRVIRQIRPEVYMYLVICKSVL